MSLQGNFLELGRSALEWAIQAHPELDVFARWCTDPLPDNSESYAHSEGHASGHWCFIRALGLYR